MTVGLRLIRQINQPRAPEAIAEAYFRADYRRDYAQAWNFISPADKSSKTRTQYLVENPPASGRPPALLAGLAAWAEFTVVSIVSTEDDHAVVMTRVRVPHPADAALAQLLAVAVKVDRDTALAQLDALYAGGQFRYVEDQRAFGPVNVNGRWGVVLHWDGAVTVRLTAAVSPDRLWEFYPVQSEIQTLPGETVQAVYRVKNLADRPITGQAKHEVQSAPEGYRSYFETIECFCFTEQTLAPGEAKDMPLIFRADFTVPPEVTGFTNGYTFYLKESFPEETLPTPAP